MTDYDFVPLSDALGDVRGRARRLGLDDDGVQRAQCQAWWMWQRRGGRVSRRHLATWAVSRAMRGTSLPGVDGVQSAKPQNTTDEADQIDRRARMPVEEYVAVRDLVEQLLRHLRPGRARVVAAVLNGGSVQAAARRLGIGENSVYRRLKSLRRLAEWLGR